MEYKLANKYETAYDAHRLLSNPSLPMNYKSYFQRQSESQSKALYVFGGGASRSTF